MRPFVAPLGLLLVVMCGGITATYITCPGCIDRTRVNSACEWSGDTRFEIDPRTPAHQRHLVSDAQLAEELAIRHADSEFNRLYGYEAHGGLIDGGRVRNECMARLVRRIETDHSVTAEQVQRARGQRNGPFDFAVALLFLPLYSVGAVTLCRRLRRRFSAHSRAVCVVATVLGSIGASAAGLQVGQLWLGAWEAIRVGNGHLSTFRAATRTQWSHQHVGVLFLAGLLVFWVIAALSFRAGTEHEDLESRAPGVPRISPTASVETRDVEPHIASD